ncbi:hypothetical protein SLE2022_232790 [Rubroshorea leprosula]
MIQCFGPWLKAELENLWCLDNIDELDVSFSNSSRPLFKEKDKDVEVNSWRNHLLDASIEQNNSINIVLNGGSHVDEGNIEDGMGLVEKGDRLIHGLVNGALDTWGRTLCLKPL